MQRRLRSKLSSIGRRQGSARPAPTATTTAPTAPAAALTVRRPFMAGSHTPSALIPTRGAGAGGNASAVSAPVPAAHSRAGTDAAGVKRLNGKTAGDRCPELGPPFFLRIRPAGRASGGLPVVLATLPSVCTTPPEQSVQDVWPPVDRSIVKNVNVRCVSAFAESRAAADDLRPAQ